MKVLFLKTETTGLKEYDEVLSLNLIRKDTGTGERKESSFLVKPAYRNSWEETIQFHGITEEDVADKPSMDAYCPMLRNAIDEADVVVGNNLAYDFKMLAQSGFAVPDKKKYVDLGIAYATQLAVNDYGEDGYSASIRRVSFGDVRNACGMDDAALHGLDATNAIEDVYDHMRADLDVEKYRGIAAFEPVSLGEINVSFGDLVKARNLRYAKDDYAYIIDKENVFPEWMEREDRMRKYLSCVKDTDVDEERIEKQIADTVIDNVESLGVRDGTFLFSYTYNHSKYFKTFDEEFLSSSYMHGEHLGVALEKPFEATEEARAEVSADKFSFFSLDRNDMMRFFSKSLDYDRKVVDIEKSGCSPAFISLLEHMAYSDAGSDFTVPDFLLKDIDLAKETKALACNVTEGNSIPLDRMVEHKDGNYVFPVELLTMMKFPLKGDWMPNGELYFENRDEEYANTVSKPAEKTGDNPFRITVIRSGSKGNCSLMEVGDKKYLIDAGVVFNTELMPALKKLGIKKIDEIDGVFITHEHVDHVKGLPMLLKKTKCPVFATEGTWEKSRWRIKEIENDRCFFLPRKMELDGMTVEKVSTCHDVKEPCGFMFHKDGYTLTYVTDNGRVCEPVKEAVRQADVLVLEANHDPSMLEANDRYKNEVKWRIYGDCGHLSNSDAIGLLKTTNAQKIYLAHLSEENNTPELLGTLLKRNAVYDRFGEENVFITKQDNLDIDKAKSEKKTKTVKLIPDGLQQDM